MDIDDLRMMTQRCNFLAEALAETLEALQFACRYPEKEYSSASKGEAVLRKFETFLEGRKHDEDIDKLEGVLTNEYQRLKRRLEALNSLTPAQRVILGIKE